MQTLEITPPNQFAYPKPNPLSQAEFRFRIGLADYATARLLPMLQHRTMAEPAANQYTGINVRLAHGAVYLEAILTHESEWGGFGFDFARLHPLSDGRYNLSIRRLEDWARAEQCTIASASVYFTETALAPRPADWVAIAPNRPFEECIESIRIHLLFEPAWARTRLISKTSALRLHRNRRPNEL